MDRRPRAARAEATHWALGEFVSIGERVVVSPIWGRVRAMLAVGDRVREGAVIGMVHDGFRDIDLVSPMAGVVLAWMAGNGERVFPGTPVARLSCGTT